MSLLRYQSSARLIGTSWFPTPCKFSGFHSGSSRLLGSFLCLLCQSLAFSVQSQFRASRGYLCRYLELLLCAFLTSCSPALSLVLLFNLWFFNSAGLPYSAWAPHPCIMVLGVPPGINLGDPGVRLVCFHSHRDHSPALLVIHHLRRVDHLFHPLLRFLNSRRSSLIPVSHHGQK